MPRNRHFKHCVLDDSYSKNIMASVTRDQQKSISKLCLYELIAI